MGLSNHITDVGKIGPMIEQVESSLRIKLSQFHADSTYASLIDIQACEALQVDLIALVKANGLTITSTVPD